VAALITADVVLGWFATRLFRRDRLIANLPNPS
jgi:hypothetical protein